MIHSIYTDDLKMRVGLKNNKKLQNWPCHQEWKDCGTFSLRWVKAVWQGMQELMHGRDWALCQCLPSAVWKTRTQWGWSDFFFQFLLLSVSLFHFKHAHFLVCFLFPVVSEVSWFFLSVTLFHLLSPFLFICLWLPLFIKFLLYNLGPPIDIHFFAH